MDHHRETASTVYGLLRNTACGGVEADVKHFVRVFIAPLTFNIGSSIVFSSTAAGRLLCFLFGNSKMREQV